MMEVVMGKMPQWMVERGRSVRADDVGYSGWWQGIRRLKKPEFFKGNKIDYPNPSVSRSSRKFVKGLKSLAVRHILRQTGDNLTYPQEIIPPNNSHNKLFLDLIVRLLDFDPETRISVSQALRHPYCALPVAEPP